MKKNMLSALFMLFFAASALAQQGHELLQIKENYIQLITGGNSSPEYTALLKQIPPEKEVSDQNVIELQQRYPVLKETVVGLIGSQQKNGSWKDINYADTKRSGWEPKIHAERLLAMSKYLHTHPQSDIDKPLKRALHRGLNFWFTSKLVCKNWWYNQIGIPRTLGPVFLLFEKEMNKTEKEEALRVMRNSKFGMTGQNKVWLAGNVLMRGLLEQDTTLVKQARDTIASEIVTGQPEGIKPDWSFHQHGPQQQFGNYGLSFLSNMSFYSNLFAGTSLAFSKEQQDVLVSFLLEGYRWIIWKGKMDINGLNRQLFHSADIHKAYTTLFAAQALMKNSTEEQNRQIGQFLKESFVQTDKPNSFCGNKPFNCSDLTIHRTPRWMASLRMASTRVIGTELVNEDNLKGYYMADGALYTYARGDEYHNIFPLWDWRRIPGITTYNSQAPIPTLSGKRSRNHSYKVGGTSDGHTGITAMQLNRNKLHANKAWIFTDQYILCLGSDIHADSTSALITCVDQRFYKGNVWEDNIRQRYFHDETGYIVLQADTCVTTYGDRAGQWHDFMGMYRPQIVRGQIFSLLLKHRTGQPASYQYLILPASSRQQVEAFDAKAIRIVRNDKNVQAVKIGNIYYIATWNHNQTITAGSLRRTIDYPGVYMLTEQGKTVARHLFQHRL